MARLNANGGIDFSFGANGVTRLPSVPFSWIEPTRSLALDSRGRIYVQGGDTFVARLSAEGVRDIAYSSSVVPAGLTIGGIAIDSADRVVVVGASTDSAHTSDVYIARFTTAGVLDATFNGTGEMYALLPRPVSAGHRMCKVVIDSGDKPLIACSVDSIADGSLAKRTDLAVMRFNSAGTLDSSFGAAQPDSDTYPGAIAFTPNSAPYGTANVRSNIVTVDGFSGTTNVGIAGGTTTGSQYSVGCTGNFTNQPGVVLPGQTLCVRHHASQTPLARVETRLDVGGRLATYVTQSTTIPSDVAPDPFVFISQSDVALNSTIVSNVASISGIDGVAPVAIQNGFYSVGCTSAMTNQPGTITNGQTICVRHASSSQPNTSVTTTLAIGGVVATFTSTAAPPDTVPDEFAFPPQSGVPTGQTMTSATVTMSGLEAPANISVSNGEYSIGCAAAGFTTQSAVIANGQSVCVRHVSASQPQTPTTTTLVVGQVSASFTTTTAASTTTPPSSSAEAKRSGGGGSLDMLLSGALLWLGCMTGMNRARRRSGSADAGALVWHEMGAQRTLIPERWKPAGLLSLEQ